MATGVAYIKSPSEFSFGEDIELFLARFDAFAEATKCEKNNRFDLFKSFLDDRSFRRVRAITFTDEHKDEGKVDMSKNVTKALIKEALVKESQVPERISLRFKVQGKDEEIEDFGDAVRLLGQKVHGQSEAETNQQVIEAFCAGLRNPDLASKLLCKQFDNLTGAINYAVSRKESTNIKQVISRQRARSWDGATESLHNAGNAVGTSSALALRQTDRGGSPVMQDRPDATPVRRGARNGSYGSGQGPSGGETRTCFRCRRVGHIERFCNQPIQPSSTGGQSVQPICYRCGVSGHMRRDCRITIPNRGTGHGQIVCFKCNTPGHTSRDCNRSARPYAQNFRGRPGNRGTSRNAWSAR